MRYGIVAILAAFTLAACATSPEAPSGAPTLVIAPGAPAPAQSRFYADCISPLGARVLVQGNPVYLSQATVVGEVRAALLAALRAAVLWRQVGGSYWDFLWSRRAMAETARELLA